MAFALAGVIVLAGCGGGSSSSSTATSALVTPGARVASHQASVAYIKTTPIPKSTYEHWLAVDTAMGVNGNAGHRALGFLITSSWVLGEAAQMHISVSSAEVEKQLTSLEHKTFPKSGQLKSYLATSHQTIPDLRERVKVEILEDRIADRVKSKGSLASFQKSFQTRWKALTKCEPGYIMEDCRQYKGKPEPPISTTASSSKKSSSQANSSGEVYSSPGAFAISSPAFERNGEIPAKYTCDGAGISPPLQWENMPKGASELVLFIIDDSSNGSEGGIRWIVAGINPSSKGIAAGKLPSGAIVGTNTAGKAAYGPICPAKGKTDTVEFVMYALKHPISLSPGFQPSVAEHDYGSTKDLLGQSAVTYAVYHRR